MFNKFKNAIGYASKIGRILLISNGIALALIIVAVTFAFYTGDYASVVFLGLSSAIMPISQWFLLKHKSASITKFEQKIEITHEKLNHIFNCIAAHFESPTPDDPNSLAKDVEVFTRELSESLTQCSVTLTNQMQALSIALDNQENERLQKIQDTLLPLIKTLSDAMKSYFNVRDKIDDTLRIQVADAKEMIERLEPEVLDLSNRLASMHELPLFPVSLRQLDQVVEVNLELKL